MRSLHRHGDRRSPRPWSDYFADDDELREVLTNDRLHVWTTEEKLATVAPDRGPVGKHWEYIGTNYLLLGLIIGQVTGRSVAEGYRSVALCFQNPVSVVVVLTNGDHDVNTVAGFLVQAADN